MKKKEPYTILWNDHLAAPYIHQVQAHGPKHALNQWGSQFSTQTMGYNFTKQEYQAMVGGHEGIQDFLKEYPEYLRLVYNASKNQTFKNVWGKSMYYDHQGILDPEAYIHLIKNCTKKTNHTFTFCLRYLLGTYLIQNEAPALEDAFFQWKEEIIAKQHLDKVVPQYALQRLQRVLKKQKNVHLSPVVNHPSVWIWRLLVGRTPCTLYIVATDDHISAN